jgi:DNA-binding CsgD family transcriptional regulator
MSLKPGERPRNTRGNPYHILAVRPLTEADLPALREKSAPWARIQKLRDSHHNIARLMASGLSNVQVANVAGVSLATVSRYRNDPAMQENVARYRDMIDEGWREEQDHISNMSVSAIAKGLRTIHDHFDDADDRGELVPMNRALSVVSDLMDRFGYGKKSANLNVNVNYAAELEAAIHRTNSLKKVAAE